MKNTDSGTVSSRTIETRKLMYVFCGNPVRTGHELVSTMREHWPTACALLDEWPNAELEDWLTARPDGPILVRALRMERTGAARLIRLQAEFDPSGAVEFQGIAIDDEALRRAIYVADPFGPEGAPDVARYVQLENAKSAIADSAVRLQSLSHVQAGGMLAQILRDMRNKQRIREEEVDEINAEIAELRSRPAVKAYEWLRDIRDHRIFRALAAVTDGPHARRFLRADEVLRTWAHQGQEMSDASLRVSEIGVASFGRRIKAAVASAHLPREVEEQVRSHLAQQFAAVLDESFELPQAQKAIASARAFLKTYESVEGPLPEAHKSFWRTAKEVAAQVAASEPTDLGRLLPAQPLLNLFASEIEQEATELREQRDRAAAERAKRERERAEAQERAEKERLTREQERVRKLTLDIANLQARSRNIQEQALNGRSRVKLLATQSTELISAANTLLASLETSRRLLEQVGGQSAERLEAAELDVRGAERASEGTLKDGASQSEVTQVMAKALLEALHAAKDALRVAREARDFDPPELRNQALSELHRRAQALSDDVASRSEHDLASIRYELSKVGNAAGRVHTHSSALSESRQTLDSARKRLDEADTLATDYIEQERVRAVKQRRLRLLFAVPTGVFWGFVLGGLGGMLLFALIGGALGLEGEAFEDLMKVAWIWLPIGSAIGIPVAYKLDE